MENQAERIIELMQEGDAFSRWLNIRVVDITPGFCQLQMVVTAEMCNSFAIAHGGIAFSLADTCCSYAVNAQGRKSVSVDNSINQFKAIHAGDTLNCTCREISLGKKLAVYTAEIITQEQVLIAHFKGTYYRSEKRWLEGEQA